MTKPVQITIPLKIGLQGFLMHMADQPPACIAHHPAKPVGTIATIAVISWWKS